MALEVISKGKETDVGEGKSDRPKARWTFNKRLFLDLTLEEKLKGNQPGKSF